MAKPVTIRAIHPLRRPLLMGYTAMMRAKVPYMTQLQAWAEVAKLILVSSQVVEGMQVPEEKLRLIAVSTQEPGRAKPQKRTPALSME